MGSAGVRAMPCSFADASGHPSWRTAIPAPYAAAVSRPITSMVSSRMRRAFMVFLESTLSQCVEGKTPGRGFWLHGRGAAIADPSRVDALGGRPVAC